MWGRTTSPRSSALLLLGAGALLLLGQCRGAGPEPAVPSPIAAPTQLPVVADGVQALLAAQLLQPAPPAALWERLKARLAHPNEPEWAPFVGLMSIPPSQEELELLAFGGRRGLLIQLAPLPTDWDHLLGEIAEAERWATAELLRQQFPVNLGSDLAALAGSNAQLLRELASRLGTRDLEGHALELVETPNSDDACETAQGWLAAGNSSRAKAAIDRCASAAPATAVEVMRRLLEAEKAPSAANAWDAWDHNAPAVAARLVAHLPAAASDWDRALLAPLTAGLLCPHFPQSFSTDPWCPVSRAASPLTLATRSNWMELAAREAPPPAAARRLLELLLLLDFSTFPTEDSSWAATAWARWNEHREAWAPDDRELQALGWLFGRSLAPGHQGSALPPLLTDDAPSASRLGRSLKLWAAAMRWQPKGPPAGGMSGKGPADMPPSAELMQSWGLRQALDNRLSEFRAPLKSDVGPHAVPFIHFGKVTGLLLELELLQAEQLAHSQAPLASPGKLAANFETLRDHPEATATDRLRAELHLALLEAPQDRTAAQRRLERALLRYERAVPPWAHDLVLVAKLYAKRLEGKAGRRWSFADWQATTALLGQRPSEAGGTPLPELLHDSWSDPQPISQRRNGVALSWLTMAGPFLPSGLTTNAKAPLLPGGTVLLPLVEPRLHFDHELWVEPLPQWVLLPLEPLLDGARKLPKKPYAR